ncbi:MAG: hypothetical protein DLD55_01375 [candidate division SR1 bacterium]|nr:MAG: hypothetical protein DLD55_01375 [candidate division SR1 bacterium]
MGYLLLWYSFLLIGEDYLNTIFGPRGALGIAFLLYVVGPATFATAWWVIQSNKISKKLIPYDIIIGIVIWICSLLAVDPLGLEWSPWIIGWGVLGILLAIVPKCKQ